MRTTKLVLTVIAALIIGSCGGGGDVPAAEPGAPAAVTPAGTAFSADELASFVRGFKAEIAAVRVAQQQAAAATDAQARNEAIQAQWETATAPAGAAAAGMNPARYGEVRAVVIDVLRTLDMQGKIEGPTSVDLTRVDDATRNRLSQDPLGALPPSSAAALRAQMDELSRLWNEYATLTAVAG